MSVRNMTITHKIAHALMMLSAAALFAEHERAEFNKLVGEIRDFDPDAPEDTETLEYGEKPYEAEQPVDDSATFGGTGGSVTHVSLNTDSQGGAVTSGEDTGAGVNITTSDGGPIGDPQTITPGDVGNLDEVLNNETTGDDNGGATAPAGFDNTAGTTLNADGDAPVTGVQDSDDATINQGTVSE